ncbi:MAG TPA: hypothetical protein ENG63_10820 [Candidatus Desulfofervidus auxilii]|uniref:Uncharacterized protein n=1 Tax=Desulfofervidus auxilii TaxID=1621989 RepID=A0A7C0YB12_DESA2|nr:hypothetical protein [Candidatus Desulfofervidus auxilii]
MKYLKLFFLFIFLTAQGEAFDIIYQRNLFSEKRSFEEGEMIKQLPIIPNMEKKVSLLGVIVIDDFKKAIIKINVPRKGKKVFSVTVGEKLGNMWIKDIKKDSLILVQGDQEYVIPLIKSPQKDKLHKNKKEKK